MPDVQILSAISSSIPIDWMQHRHPAHLAKFETNLSISRQTAKSCQHARNTAALELGATAMFEVF